MKKKKKIIIISDTCRHTGILKSANYLNIFLNKKYDTALILTKYPYNLFKIREDIKKLSINKEIVLLVHECQGLAITHLKRHYNAKAYFFIPGPVYLEEKHHKNLKDYDGLICSNPIIKNQANTLGLKYIEWIFDFPELQQIPLNNFLQRSNELLFIGRVIPEKISPEQINEILLNNLSIKIIGEHLNDNSNKVTPYSSLIDKKNIIFQDKIPHHQAIETMQKHKFIIITSKTDNFSLATLEAIYQGCIPLILDNNDIRYSWVTQKTQIHPTMQDLITYAKNILMMGIQEQQELAFDHRSAVIKHMKRLSSFNNLPF
ncbi:glycosyltransferase [Halobacteriovorax sp. YZS-1-1]|uniref:glycosyltransferase n=1 Tax=unclassified Halobacteriovorax TaxID=2639665 RepID=UPI00399A87A7